MTEERRRPPGRPRRHAPGRINATVRFSPSRHQDLKKAAEAAGRSVSEEVEHRMERLAHYEMVIAEVKEWQAKMAVNIEAAERSNLEAVLLRRNWKKLHGASFNSGNWISPDNHNLPPGGFLSEEEAASFLKPAAQPSPIDMEALSRLVERAVKQAFAEAKLAS